MSQVSEIQWTDATWNPVTGCTKVSPGCAHCYIERTPPFRMTGRRFAAGTIPLRLHHDRLEQPLRWRKPRRVFVNSLSDLFHEDVPFEFIDSVFATMAFATQHTFQLLTKRPERLRAYWASFVERELDFRWPLPNVWLGVSIENSRFTWRADVLRQVPAAVRFISAEPLLGSLFAEPSVHERRREREASMAVVEGFIEDGMRPDDASAYVAAVEARVTNHATHPLELDGISWLIAGGESGPGARPLLLDWVRELLERCSNAGVPVFVKQLGAKPVERHPYIAGVADSYSRLELRDRKGGDLTEWPNDLRIREFPRG